VCVFLNFQEKASIISMAIDAIRQVESGILSGFDTCPSCCELI
jgi:hypothetical protein